MNKIETLIELINLSNILTALVLSLVTAFFAFGWKHIKKVPSIFKALESMPARMDGVESALKDLTIKVDRAEERDKRDARANIVSIYNTAKARGYITESEMEQVYEDYEDYSTRGGNTYIGDLVTHMAEMPRESDAIIEAHRKQTKEEFQNGNHRI